MCVECECARVHLFDHLKGAKEVASVASLVWVADKVGVQLLVAFQCDATLGLVIILFKRKELILMRI